MHDYALDALGGAAVTALAVIFAAGLALGSRLERWRTRKLLRTLRAEALRKITDEATNRPFAYALVTQIERAIHQGKHWGRL